MTRWIVGLGNPGPRYRDTRHNAGMWFVDRLAEDLGVPLRKPWLRPFFWAKVVDGHDELVLLRPDVMMNVSAVALDGLVRSAKLTPETLLVVFDQMDLPAGSVRWKRKGSSGGHNGLKSLDGLMGERDYARLAVGIGRPQSTDVVSHVLGVPSPEDRLAMDVAIRQAAGLVALHWNEGWEGLIHDINGLRPSARPVSEGISSTPPASF